MMTLHYCFIGVIYLLALFVPNFIWLKYQPNGYSTKSENHILLLIERIGQVLVTCFAIVSFDEVAFHFNLYLILSMLLMMLYELYWIRYFFSPRTLHDFYRSFLKIPLPGAILPILSFLLLALNLRNMCLIFSVFILAIGHIGIHYQHLREI